MLVGAIEGAFYLTSLAAFAWAYFSALLKIAEWRRPPPKALALISYIVFAGVSLLPLLAVERALAWPALAAWGDSPDALIWALSLGVSTGTLFLAHRRRLRAAGYFQS